MRIQVCIAASLLSSALFLTRSTFSDDAGQLFQKMQQALGGARKIAAISDFEETVHADTWDRNGNSLGEVRKRVRWIRPNLLRIDQVGRGDTYVLYFNGVFGWEILPDGKFAELAGGELKFAQHYLLSLDLNRWLADRDPRYVIASPTTGVVVISTRDDTSDKIEYTLDPQTFLPFKTASVSLSDPGHPVESETRLEDWQEVDGVKFPRRITNYHGGRKLALIVVDEILVNHGLKAADLAAQPTDLKPVMAQASK